MRLSAERSRRRSRLINSLLVIAVIVLTTRHVATGLEVGSLGNYLYSHWVIIFSFVALGLTLLLSQRERTFRDIEKISSKFRVGVVVPVYNEDPDLLLACLKSIIQQSRKINELYVVNDGSTINTYDEIKASVVDECKDKRIYIRWINKPNGGKRSAQAEGFKRSFPCDIIVTVDSDSILDSRAIEEIIKPFSDKKIQSVAGVVLATNNTVNLLTRITDILYVTGQLIDRSLMSFLGSVLVNSGGLAAYRYEIIEKYLDAYLHETFFGRSVEFSDDSMLTLYSLENGKTVQQPTAFVFTANPETFNHHIRQQIRWMKGSFIRSWWRIKYLPINSFGFMRQLMSWSQFIMTTMLVILILVSRPVSLHNVLFFMAIILVIVAYVQALRYLMIKRTDESLKSQLATYLLAPVALLWTYVVLRPIRIYAAFQCFKNDWGTRSVVEVSLHPKSRESTGSFLRLKPFMWIPWKTEYERLFYKLKSSSSSTDMLRINWMHHYYSLSDTKRHSLWKSYVKYCNRKKIPVAYNYF